MIIIIRPLYVGHSSEIKFYWNQSQHKGSLKSWIRIRKDKIDEVDKSVTQVKVKGFSEFNEGKQELVTKLDL